MNLMSDNVVLPHCAGPGAMISDDSDNAELLDFCFLCSRQFFHEGLENFDIGVKKDEEILESFFEELGPVDRALLDCCPSCKTVCKTLISTKEALSCLIDEIFSMLRESRNFSFLASKNQVVARLFQPPSHICETSSSYLQNFPKDISNVSSNSANSVSVTSFPSQFDLRLDSSNLSDSLDLNLSHNPISHNPIAPPVPSANNSLIKAKSSPRKERRNFKDKLISNLPNFTGEGGGGNNSNSGFNSLFNETISTMINSASDNACDVSEVVIRHNQKESREIFENFRPPLPLPSKLPLINICGNETSFTNKMAQVREQRKEAQEINQTQVLENNKEQTTVPAHNVQVEAIENQVSLRQVKYVPMAAPTLNMTASELIMEMHNPPVLMSEMEYISAPGQEENQAPGLAPKLILLEKEPQKKKNQVLEVESDSVSSPVPLSSPIRKQTERKAPALIPIQSYKVDHKSISAPKVNIALIPTPNLKKTHSRPPPSLPDGDRTAPLNVPRKPKSKPSSNKRDTDSNAKSKSKKAIASEDGNTATPMLPLPKGGKNLNAIKPKNIKRNEQIILKRKNLASSSVSSKNTEQTVQIIPKTIGENVADPVLANKSEQIAPKTTTENIPKKKLEKMEGETDDDKMNPHFCAKCNESFTASKYLKKHNNHIHRDSKQEGEKFVCQICGTAYKQKRGLKYHIAAMHSDTPQFKCEICDKTFTQKAGLQRHYDLHNGKHQFQCDLCGKQFIHHSSFKAHMVIHKGPATKDIKCPECGLEFTQRSHLQRHLRIHTGEKLHSCPFCDKSFSERYNLRSHLRSHEENRESLKCPNCPKTFVSKHGLRKHIRIHHSSEPNINQDDLGESTRSSIDDSEPEESDS